MLVDVGNVRRFLVDVGELSRSYAGRLHTPMMVQVLVLVLFHQLPLTQPIEPYSASLHLPYPALHLSTLTYPSPRFDTNLICDWTISVCAILCDCGDCGDCGHTTHIIAIGQHVYECW